MFPISWNDIGLQSVRTAIHPNHTLFFLLFVDRGHESNDRSEKLDEELDRQVTN